MLEPSALRQASPYYDGIFSGIEDRSIYQGAQLEFAVLAQVLRGPTSELNFGVTDTPELEWVDITGPSDGSLVIYEGDWVKLYVGLADLSTNTPIRNWHQFYGDSVSRNDTLIVDVSGFLVNFDPDSVEIEFAPTPTQLRTPELTSTDGIFNNNIYGWDGGVAHPTGENWYNFGEFVIDSAYAPDTPGSEDVDNDNQQNIKKTIDIQALFPNPEFGHLQDPIMGVGVTGAFEYVDLADDQYPSFPENIRPVAVDDNVFLSPNTSQVYVNVLANDHYPGGDLEDVTVTIGLGPSTGTAEVIGNTIVFRPGDDFAVADSLIYEISTGSGLPVFASVSFSTQPFFLFGFDDNDELWGSEAGDLFEAGDGNDVLRALAGDDTLNGEGGDDQLFGGLGDDLLFGGDGNDTAVYSAATALVEVYLNAELSRGALGRDRLVDVENVVGSDYNDRLIGNVGVNTLYGGDGDDILKGKGGNDTFFGGAGNDTIRGDSGADKFYGSVGNDVLLGLAGDDLLNGEDGDDFLYGGRDDDTLIGADGNDVLRGNRGNDFISGDAGTDDIRGGGGNDTLNGGAGNDYILGGNGADRLSGGAGNDTLVGGPGAGVDDGVTDVFIIKPFEGFDRLRDFENGIDVLDLSGFGFSNFAQVLDLAVDAGATDMRLNFGGSDVIYLDGFRLSEFDASDVVLI